MRQKKNRDHFCEGLFINQSIADGIMLRLLRQLKLVCPMKNLPTTLENIYRLGGENILERPGVYWVLCLEGMPNSLYRTGIQSSCSVLFSGEVFPQIHGLCNPLYWVLERQLKQYMNYGWKNTTDHNGSRAMLHVPKIEQRGSARGQGQPRGTISRRRKALKIKAFWAKQHFDAVKMLGG